MQIPFFRYPHVFEAHRDELVKAFLDVASRGAFVLQEEVIRFEESLAQLCGARHAIGVANATDGLELALSAGGLAPGDEVILASHTFVATAGAVVANGATPIFAEIGPDHLLDPQDVESRITDRTRAIIPTQLNGRTAAMEPFIEMAESHDLLLVEDSAQGLGSKYRGRMAGTFGRAGVYSFYPAKSLGALGDAGALVTDDSSLAREVRQRRDHGRIGAGGEVLRWGRNTRLDNIQAAFLLVKIDHFEGEVARRRELAGRYQRNLTHISPLVLPPAPCGTPHFDVFQNYEIETDHRDELRGFLKGEGVGTSLPWGGKGVHQLPSLGITSALPRTEAILARSLLLPMNTSLLDEEVDRICELMDRFYSAH